MRIERHKTANYALYKDIEKPLAVSLIVGQFIDTVRIVLNRERLQTMAWGKPKQLSTGERDAKQDAFCNGYDKVNKNVRTIITWQEDPEGLQLGEAADPGDSASGANVTGGTDIWTPRLSKQLRVHRTTILIGRQRFALPTISKGSTACPAK